MPIEDWVQHCIVARFLHDWQTGLAGLIALLAALIGFRMTSRKDRYLRRQAVYPAVTSG